MLCRDKQNLVRDNKTINEFKSSFYDILSLTLFVIDSVANDSRKRGKLGAIEHPTLLPGINSVLLLRSWNSIILCDYVTLWQADLVSCYTFFTFKRKFGGEKKVYFNFCCISKNVKRSAYTTSLRIQLFLCVRFWLAFYSPFFVVVTVLWGEDIGWDIIRRERSGV